jgi:hypothetical protein
MCGPACTGPDKRKANAQVDKLWDSVDEVKAQL